MNSKVDSIKLIGWITHETLKKVVVFSKPKGKCIKVEIEIVPIKEKKNNERTTKTKR